MSGIFAQQYMTLDELRQMKKEAKAGKTEKNRMPVEQTAPMQPGTSVKLGNVEVLAEGSYSKIEKPFIFIARTESDYEMLKTLVDEFSSNKVIDFKKQAVVAAFAGQRNSGGYSVSIEKLQGQVDVRVKNPPKDSMFTQAITYPYQIALVPIEEEDSLKMAVSEDFQNEMTTYKLTSGNFEFSGGFIGRQTKFEAVGNIKMMKHNEFVTFLFGLNGKGNEKNRSLNEMSSGMIENNSAKISRVEAGSFIDRPHPPLQVSVNMEGNKLSMKFEPGKRDYVISDGYEGSGSLEAVKQN